MSPLIIIAIALCWLVIPATPFALIWLLASRKSTQDHSQARPSPSQSHSLAGGDDVFGRHVATRNTTVSE